MLFSYLAEAESELLRVQQTIKSISWNYTTAIKLRRALKHNVHNLSLNFSSQKYQ